MATPAPVSIGLGGNGYITKDGENANINDDPSSPGLFDWTSPNTVCSVYFYAEKGGKFNVSLRCSVSGTSTISVTYGELTVPVTLEGAELYEQPVAEFEAPGPGHVRIDLQGVSKTGRTFGDIKDLVLTSHDLGHIMWTDEPQNYTWGVRGPSMDVSFSGEPDDNEYFYNELTVPAGTDITGCYFMAAGFDGGYFGLQSNEDTRRTILFSVWSTYSTDDPSAIPSEYTVKALRTGNDVVLSAFGGEGSGSHVNFDYWWKSGVTYKFLVRGKTTEGKDETKYTGWFWTPELGWKMMATFVVPKKTIGSLTGLYSFSEGLGPTGWQERKVLFGNQWARGGDGKWVELVDLNFDNEGQALDGHRRDRMCGVEDGQFFVRNCGYFNETTESGSNFSRGPTGREPDVDLDALAADYVDPETGDPSWGN